MGLRVLAPNATSRLRHPQTAAAAPGPVNARFTGQEASRFPAERGSQLLGVS